MIGITTCLRLRTVLKCWGLELGFRGPANIGIGIGEEVIYAIYLGFNLGLEFLLHMIQRLGLSLGRKIEQLDTRAVKNVKPNF